MEDLGLNKPLQGLIYYKSGNNTIPESAGINNPGNSTCYEHIGAITYIGNSRINVDTNQLSTKGIINVFGASSGP